MLSLLGELMTEYGQIRHFSKGEHLAQQGYPLQWFVFLLEGKVKIEQIALNGKSILLGFYQAGPGEPESTRMYLAKSDVMFIGDLELFSRDKTANSTVTAITEVRCALIRESLMQKQVEQSVALSNCISESLALKMASYSNVSSINLLYSLKQRYAYYLLEILESGAPVPISLEQSASLLGTSTRHLQRVLAELESAGCIERQGRFLHLESREKLKKSAGTIAQCEP
jgi:CRP-like cAMP-binding protein